MAITILRGEAAMAFEGVLTPPSWGHREGCRAVRRARQTPGNAAEAVLPRAQTLSSSAQTVLPFARDPSAVGLEALPIDRDPSSDRPRPCARRRRPSSDRPGPVFGSAETLRQAPQTFFRSTGDLLRIGGDPRPHSVDPLSICLDPEDRSGIRQEPRGSRERLRSVRFALDGPPQRRCQLIMSVAARGRAPLSKARTPKKGSEPESSRPTSVPSASRTPACAATRSSPSR